MPSRNTNSKLKKKTAATKSASASASTTTTTTTMTTALKYIEALYKNLPGRQIDNTRITVLVKKSEDQLEPEFFHGKLCFRFAGTSNDFDTEPAKTRFMAMTERMRELKLHSQPQESLQTHLESLHFRFHQSNAPRKTEQFHKDMLWSSELFALRADRAAIHCILSDAQQWNIMLQLLQNSADLVIRSFVDASRSAKAVALRNYFFLHMISDRAGESLEMAEKRLAADLKKQSLQTMTLRDKLAVDHRNAAEICVPYFSPLFYDAEFVGRILYSHLQTSSKDAEFVRTLAAPMLIPASCQVDCDDMWRGHVPACFDISRIVELKNAIFASTPAPRKHFSVNIPCNQEHLTATERPLTYFWNHEKLVHCTNDARVLLASELLPGANDPFHIYTPRKFVCSQVLLFAISLNLAMWTLAAAGKAKYNHYEELKYVLQQFHPTIGMDYFTFSPANFLRSFKEMIPEIIYHGKSIEEVGARAAKLELLARQLAQFLTVPVVSESTTTTTSAVAASPVPDLYSLMVEPKHLAVASNLTYETVVQSSDLLFDSLLPLYQEIMPDLTPFVREYFSLPALTDAPELLSTPVLQQDSWTLFHQLSPEANYERLFAYQNALPSNDKVCACENVFVNAVSGTSFRQEDIQDFVNMEKYIL